MEDDNTEITEIISLLLQLENKSPVNEEQENHIAAYFKTILFITNRIKSLEKIFKDLFDSNYSDLFYQLYNAAINFIEKKTADIDLFMSITTTNISNEDRWYHKDQKDIIEISEEIISIIHNLLMKSESPLPLYVKYESPYKSLYSRHIQNPTAELKKSFEEKCSPEESIKHSIGCMQKICDVIRDSEKELSEEDKDKMRKVFKWHEENVELNLKDNKHYKLVLNSIKHDKEDFEIDK